MGLHPKITDTRQPLCLQPIVRHPDLRCLRARQVPVALAADSRQDRRAFAHAQRQKVADLGAGEAPLFPAKRKGAAAKRKGAVVELFSGNSVAKVRHQ